MRVPQPPQQTAPPKASERGLSEYLGEGFCGEGYAKILESSGLSISRAYTAVWKKDAIDLTELAHKRWINKWTMDRLAAHFDCGRTAVVRHI
jgi:hypothetical protein